jgi:hypothetical protein
VLKTLQTAVEKVSRIKLRGGMFGNVCTVIIVLVLVIGVVAVAARNEYVSGGAILLAVTLCWNLLSRMIKFAEKNPAAAILDGAHYIERERIMIASKGNPAVMVDVTSLTQETSRDLAPPSSGSVTPLLDEPEHQ